MDINVLQAVDFLKQNDKYLIFTHASPDGDTIGSAIALRLALEHIGKAVMVICPDEIPGRLRFIPYSADITVSLPQNYREMTMISVDVASLAMLRGLPDDFLKSLCFDLSIDHHRVNTIPCNKRLLCDEYPAAGEIVAEVTKALGVKLDREMAIALYTAISSDSGCFKYSSTRPQTHMIAAELLATGIDFAKINRLLFENKTPGQITAEKAAYNSVELFYGGRVAVVCLSDSLFSDGLVSDSDVDTVNQIPRQISGVEVSAVIRNKKGETKVSLRSNDYYDVAALASSFGGGGHVHAAGCRFANGLEDAKQRLLEALKADFHGD